MGCPLVLTENGLRFQAKSSKILKAVYVILFFLRPVGLVFPLLEEKEEYIRFRKK